MTRPRKSSRHRSREVALQVLYAIDLSRNRVARSALRPIASLGSGVFEEVAGSFETPEGAKAFAKDLVCQVDGRREALDRILAQHAHNWRLSRMATVDRNILRLATYELAHTEAPAAVVLNEAVELARRFGSEASPAFVNGVLDAVARAVRVCSELESGPDTASSAVSHEPEQQGRRDENSAGGEEIP